MNHEHKPLSAEQLALVNQMTDALLDSCLSVREARQVCAALRSRVEYLVSSRLFCDVLPAARAEGPLTDSSTEAL